jgi:hypothetical protein
MKNSILHTHRTGWCTLVSAISLTCLMVASTPAAAGSCRSGLAASRGSQTGYERDRKGADQTEQQDRSASDILGRCVSGITSVATIQQFPSLSEIYEQIKTQVCKVASEQVHAATNDANSRINGAMGGIDVQGAQASGNSSTTSGASASEQTATPNVPNQGAEATSGSAFWKNIWR